MKLLLIAALLAPLPALSPHALLAADAGALAGAWDCRFAARPLFSLAGYANASARRARPALAGALLAAPAAQRDAVLCWELSGGGGGGARPPAAATPAAPSVDGCFFPRGGGAPFPALLVLSTSAGGAQLLAEYAPRGLGGSDAALVAAAET